MNTYQLTIHFSPQLAKEKSEKLQESIIKEIEKNEGNLIEKNSLSKVQLDYTISDFSQAVLWDIDIELPGQKVQEIKNYLADQPKVLRAMLTKKIRQEKPKTKSTSKDKKQEKTKEKKESKKKSEQEAKAEKQATDKKKKKEEEKVELDNIDDKLDQILEEDMWETLINAD